MITATESAVTFTQLLLAPMSLVEQCFGAVQGKLPALLTGLPKQVIHDLQIVPALLRDTDDRIVISGDIHDEEVEEGSPEEIHEDLDVCVYTSVSV